MKKFIKYLFLFISFGVVLSGTAIAADMNEHSPFAVQTDTEEDDYITGSEAGVMPYNVFDTNENSINDEIHEATVEENEIKDEPFTHNMELMSDTVDFYTETNQYVAKGNALLIIPEEELELYANEIIVDHRNYEIIGIGNVKILKAGAEYYGDYIRLNTKKESSFFTNPILYYTDMTVSAEKAYMHTNDTDAENGSAMMKQKQLSILSTVQNGGIDPVRIFDFDAIKEFDSENNTRVVAKKIKVKRFDDRTDVYVENATLYKGKTPVGYSPTFKLSTNKDVNYIETIFPEMGNHTRIGMYFAPGYVLGLPKGATLKVGPLVSLDTHSKFGLGAFARLSTPKGISRFMYSSNTNKFVVDLNYDITDNLKIHAVANDYMNGGWMGGQLPDYGIELEYNKNSDIPQANLLLTNSLRAGFYADNKTDYENYQLRTFRYRWEMEANNKKPLLAWEKYLMLGYSYQHAFSLYQTGDVVGILRLGPRLYSDLGRLSMELTYFLGAQTGESPFLFDRYRYGNNNIRFRAQYYVNKYISLGYYGAYNIGQEDYDGNRLTENQFIAAVGTEDVKIRFGYDTVRKSSVIGLDVLLGKDKTYLEFDKMNVQNLEPKAGKEKNKNKKKRL